MKYACPTCGNTDRLHVAVHTEVLFVQDEQHISTQYDKPDGGEYWHQASPIRCGACGVSGTVADFTVRPKPVAPAYGCPTCGSTDLQVTVTGVHTLVQRDSGHLETNPTSDDAQWGDYSAMTCCACGHDAHAEEFRRDFRPA